MATTALLQRHAGEGETIAEAIRDCLDYGKNPEKTESGKYISAYECDPATVADEFLLAKASYAAMTGREQKKENNVLCYQIRQSFYPGEITPKEANRIGYELAMSWTKGRHAFIVTTHTDRQHIHCHIYYSLDRDDGLEHEAVFVALSPHELYERKVTMQELHAAIASLPDKQAKRIYAHFILGMTKQDIARAEGVHEKVVRVAIERGLRHLEKILKNSL